MTGGGSGIGRAIAERFAAEGARVVVAGRRAERLADVVRAIGGAGGAARAVACDVAAPDAAAALVAAAVDGFGRLDVLVNNAAQNRPDTPVAETVADCDDAWWAATLDVNLTAAFRCCRAAVPAMLATGGGVVINVASTSGIAGNTNQSAYVASKHGLVGLTRAMALDYAARGIRANAICPGFIDTERSRRFSALHRGPDWEATKLAEIPVRRLGRPEEVAALATYLASDEAAFVTGAVIPIDGGTAARRG